MPKNKRSKNHHYVPKVLQRAFCFEREKLWYSERKNNSRLGQPELRNISSAFKQRNLYTVLDGDKLTDIVERGFYGKIDDHLGKIVPKCIEILDEGNAPEFSGKALKDLQLVVYELLKRTPDFVEYESDEEIGRELIQKTLDRALENAEFADEVERLKDDLQDSNRLVALGRDIRVRGSIRQPGVEVFSALSTLDVRWAISSGKHSFVLSSKIAHRIGNGGTNGLRNPEAEIWMPISPKYALVLVRDPSSRIPLRVAEGRDHMRLVNEYAAAGSSALASHSERLLKSLIG